MLYLDTSVVVSLLTTEPATVAVTEWFTELRELPVSSDWLLTEFASAISIKIRTGQLTESNAKLIRKEFAVFASGGIRLAPVTRGAFKDAAALAQIHKSG